MDRTPDIEIQIKVAIALKKLLSENKAYPTQINNEEETLDSYEKIAIATDLRKATVNDIFNANTKSRIITLIPIVEVLGFSMKVFGKMFDSVTIKDIKDFEVSKRDKEKQRKK